MGFLEFVGELIQWAMYLWWAWLLILAWFWYDWARKHLGFSPLLAIVVGAILVYYLVIEHPLVGSAGMIFLIVMTTGIIWMIPIVIPILNLIRGK